MIQVQYIKQYRSVKCHHKLGETAIFLRLNDQTIINKEVPEKFRNSAMINKSSTFSALAGYVFMQSSSSVGLIRKTWHTGSLCCPQNCDQSAAM